MPSGIIEDDLSIDGQKFELNFNPRFKANIVNSGNIENFFTDRTIRTIACGLLEEVEGIKPTLVNDYDAMLDTKNIKNLNDDDRILYLEYLEKIVDTLKETNVSDIITAIETQKEYIFKTFPKEGILGNKSLEAYFDKNETPLLNVDVKMITNTAATRQQLLEEKGQKGSIITRKLLKPNKTNIFKPSALIDLSLINEKRFLNVSTKQKPTKKGLSKRTLTTITFDTLQYMKEIFERYDYDKPFEFQEEKSETLTGALGKIPASIDPDFPDGVMLATNRIILTETPKMESSIIKNSYIDGEGLEDKTTIISGIEYQRKDNLTGLIIPAYNYITISPPFDDDSASNKETTFTITYVNRNDNSITKVISNSSVERITPRRTELMWFQAYSHVDKAKLDYDLYVDDGTTSPTTPVREDLTYGQLEEAVSGDNWITAYKYKGVDNAIDEIIAQALTSRIKKTNRNNIEYEVVLPLGILEIEVESSIDAQFQDTSDGEQSTQSKTEAKLIEAEVIESNKKKLEKMIPEYEKYKDFIVPFSETKNDGPDEFAKRVSGKGASNAEITRIYVDLERMANNESSALLESKEFYLAMLILAKNDVDPQYLSDNINKPPEEKYLGGVGNFDNTMAMSVLYGALPEEKGSKFAPPSKIFEPQKESESEREERLAERMKTQKLIALYDRGVGKIPLIRLKKVTARYKKELLLSGVAGLPDISGDRIEVKDNINTARRVVRGIKNFLNELQTIGGRV